MVMSLKQLNQQIGLEESEIILVEYMDALLE